MTGDDLLARAAQALRDERRGASDGAAFTERRILATLAARGQARRRRIVWMLPLAAAFVASGAWATATGRTAALVRVAADVLHLRPRAAEGWAEPAAGRPEATAPTATEALPPPATEALPPPALEALPPPAPEAPAPARPAGSPAPRKATPAPRPEAAPEAAPAALPAEALYREAHRLHFEVGEPGAALRAWDHYLATAPAGTFAPEARFNRAICLVRLRRTAEARAALEPFAQGHYGEYRRSEAQRLLAALPPSPPSP